MKLKILKDFAVVAVIIAIVLPCTFLMRDKVDTSKTKISFEYMEGVGAHTPCIDQYTLPLSMKNYEYYDVIDMKNEDFIEDIIKDYPVENLIDNDKTGWWGVYKKSLILLYSKDKKLLGYAVVPEIKSGQIYVNFREYKK